MALPEVLADAEVSLEFGRKYHNRISVEFTLPFRQAVRALSGRTRGPGTFDDDDFEEATFVEEAKGNQTALGFYWVMRQQVAFLLGELEVARRCAEEGRKRVRAGIIGMFISADNVLYGALLDAAALKDLSPDAHAPLLARMEEAAKTLGEWARFCPGNFQHKEQLVRAELARLRGMPAEAMKLYGAAAKGASRHEFPQDAALCNELRARFLLRSGERRLAADCLRSARDGYAGWGATAKVSALEKAHPELRDRTGDGRPPPRLTLDSLGLIKASQAISAETHPERLFARILEIVTELAGAQQSALVLCAGDELRVRARVTATDRMETSLEDRPLSECPDLPEVVARYVARLKEPLVLADARAEGPFTGDRWVRANQLRSVLCVPLEQRAQLVGLLYLQNNALAGAFTQERLEVVKVLAAQAAISLENSTLLQERSRAESTARFLASAGTALAESLDYGTTVAQAVRLAVPGFADWCLLDLVQEDGRIERVEAVHADPEQAPLAAQIKRFAAAPDGRSEHPPTRVLLEHPAHSAKLCTEFRHLRWRWCSCPS